MSLQESTDIRKLIKFSLHLQDGQKYKRPEGFFVPVPPRQIRKVEPSASFIPRSGTLPTRSLTKRSPKTAQEVLRPRANSLKRITVLNSRINSTETITVDHHELGISDGYLEDDPAVLKMNLDHMARVMAISRLKLQQYVSTLRENLQPKQNAKVFQCLDGMEELCAFMEPRPGAVHRDRNQTAPAGQMSYMSPPVERAFAADETFVGTTPRGGDLTSTPKTTRSTPGSKKTLSQQEVKTEFVRTLKDCDTTITTTTTTTENSVMEENATESQTVLMTGSFLNDTRQSSSNGGSSSTSTEGASSSYEFPEQCTPRMAQRVIGNRKEVELVEIVSSSSCSSASAGGQEEVGCGGGQRREGGDFVPSRNPQMERKDST